MITHSIHYNTLLLLNGINSSRIQAKKRQLLQAEDLRLRSMIVVIDCPSLGYSQQPWENRSCLAGMWRFSREKSHDVGKELVIGLEEFVYFEVI